MYIWDTFEIYRKNVHLVCFPVEASSERKLERMYEVSISKVHLRQEKQSIDSNEIL